MGIKKILDKIDLSKKYPKYFNKWIFRGAFILILILGIFVFITNDFSLNHAWAECPEDAKTRRCTNPYHDLFCDGSELCMNEFILPGETIGYKPTSSYQGFDDFAIFILIAAGMLNHILYRWGQKK